MLARLQTLGENSLDGAPPPAASRDQIGAIVDTRHVAPSSKANKWKMKNARHPQLERPSDHQEPQASTADLLREGARGRKCRIVSVPDVEASQRDRLACSNEDVDAKGQMGTMTVHRSMMVSDTAHIDDEVELSALLEEGLTMDHN